MPTVTWLVFIFNYFLKQQRSLFVLIFKSIFDFFQNASDSKYADQKKVYNDLGAGVLKNAWEGYNASLFAYGKLKKKQKTKKNEC